MPWNMEASPVRDQAANTLLRARKLPPGPYRNDLRQLGVGLLKLYKRGLRGNQIVDRRGLQSEGMQVTRSQTSSGEPRG
jgi:hypothetical protein